MLIFDELKNFATQPDILVQVVPSLLQRGIAPLPYLGQRGRQIGLIRPSTRLAVEVPFVDATWITPAPPPAEPPREKARYAHRKCQPGHRANAKKGA